jgi:hypothetical protein
MAIDIEKSEVDVGRSSSDESKPTAIDHERAELLANLPDPDAGKTDEEKAAIVYMTSLHRPSQENV